MTEPIPRRAFRNLGLAVVLIFVALLGGTVTSQYITVVRGVMAIIGAGFVLAWLVKAPRQADLVDKLVLGALLLFLLTCLTSQVPRLSLHAGVAAMAFTAALFAARRLVADPAARDYIYTVLGLIGVVVSVLFAVFWGAFWLRWIAVSGMAPPLDLILPVGPYRHYQVVAMAVTAFVPAVVVLARRPLIWPVAWVGLLASAAVILMSGTRTIWLALLVVGMAIGARGALRPRHIANAVRGRPVLIGVGVVLLVGVVLIGSSVSARLLTSSTVDLRGAIWGATLQSWLQHPLFGSGPGTFGVAITQSGFFRAYDSVGQHADDAPVQLLAESGVLGVAAMLLLAGALVAGWKRGTGVAPLAGIGLLVAMSFTNNPSVYAHLVVVGLVWFALATPAEPVPDHALTPSRRWLLMPTLAAGGAVAVTVSLMLGASLAHDRARAAALAGDDAVVVAELATARTLDPGYPVYWRDSALWLMVQGREREAMLDLGRAIALNPTDTTALRIAAYLASSAGDDADAVSFASRAESLRTTDPVNALMVAYVAARGGNGDAADAALVQALRRYPWLTAAPDWPAVSTGSPSDLLDAAKASWHTKPDQTGRWGQAQAWLGALTGSRGDPAELGPIQTAVSLTLECRMAEAGEALGGLSQSDLASTGGLLARVFYARAQDESADEAIMLAALRWPLLRMMATIEVPGQSPLIEPDEDLRLYGRYSISAPPIGPVFPTSESGLSAWLRDPAVAADRGAPAIALALCL